MFSKLTALFYIFQSVCSTMQGVICVSVIYCAKITFTIRACFTLIVDLHSKQSAAVKQWNSVEVSTYGTLHDSVYNMQQHRFGPIQSLLCFLEGCSVSLLIWSLSVHFLCVIYISVSSQEYFHVSNENNFLLLPSWRLCCPLVCSHQGLMFVQNWTKER